MSIRPQAGPQMDFLSSSADIAIYGGAAGGGKSWSLLMEPLRHVSNPGFGAVVFRRNMTQVTNEGGLWDESAKIYGVYPGAKPRLSQPMQWEFPSGAKITFAHLESEMTVLAWQGSQIPLLMFDELTHFKKSQFFYMLSRNRSMCGITPYVRGTCNPDADSWVADFISWWIDQDTGCPIPERSGVIRYFVRIGDNIQWSDTPDGLPVQQAPDGQIVPPKSVTFIAAKLSDNKLLMAADPGYYANLMSLPTVERERLLGGNWKIRPAAGLYFRRAWCEVVDAVPHDLDIVARGWDLAATEKTETNDPDWTAGVKIGRSASGAYYVMHADQLRGAPMAVELMLQNTASSDGRQCVISAPQDPGQSGKSQALRLVQMLAGYNIRTSVESRGTLGNPAKVSRFGPFSAQAQAGNVKVLRGVWNDEWFTALEGFPEASHDDYVDATSRAFEAVCEKKGFTITDEALSSIRAIGKRRA